LAGLAVERLREGNRTAKLDLGLAVEALPQGLAAALEYNTDLFDRTTAARLLGHWAALLGAMVAAPGVRVADLPLLAAGERHQLLCEWSDTEEAPAAPLLLHELFTRQARRRPQAPALVAHGEGLSYGELDRRSAAVAQRLRRLGVGPETRVGLCL